MKQELIDERPLGRDLVARVRAFHDFDDKVEKAALKHGRPFIGIERPKGYRHQPGQCFRSAGKLASCERGIYVEGFAMPYGQAPVHHGWLTLDGIHAIDVTFKNPSTCRFFGIPFSLQVLQRWTSRRGYWGLLSVFHSDAEIEELLDDAVAHPPIFS